MPLIRSLHHVTATVNDAQADLDFYAGLLGQRLVKKTVNFDNHHVFHFYYGNEQGTPGTIITTFPYKGMGVRVGVQGAGQVSGTSFSVPAASMEFWRARLAEHHVVFEGWEVFGEQVLRLRDPSGLVIQIVGCDRDDRTPWSPSEREISADVAQRGLHGVVLSVRDPDKSIAFLTEVMSGRVLARSAAATRVGVGGSAPGHFVDIVRASAGTPSAVNGLGTVHHVAFAIDTEDEQLAIREELVRRGISVTEVRDRQYFRSIYFREPNGILYEIATIPPGFTVDEDLAQLGTSLKLPPWEEPNRADIEAHLPQITAS